MEKARQSISEISRLLVAALIASLLVVIAPSADQSHASSPSIIANNQVCDLGDPNDHSTSATAFEITNSDELWEVTDCVSSSSTIYFKLMNDINVSDPAGNVSTASPIGFSTSSTVYSFNGVLNGQDHEIYGISMSASTDGVGLFGLLSGATVSNLVISGAFYTAAGQAGALAPTASGTIHLMSVSNRASVQGVSEVGGLVGRFINPGAGVLHLIEDSSNEGTISGTSKVGGLVGSAGIWDSIVVSSSHNSGPVTATGNQAAGLVGHVNAGSMAVILSSNRAEIRAGGTDAGGLVGISGATSISRSHNAGSVSSVGNYAGGLVGRSGDLDAMTASNTGAILGTTYVGGIAGYAGGSVTASWLSNSGQVSASGDAAGGLVGYANSGSISYSYNAASVSAATKQAGGLLGWVNDTSTVLESGNSGNVVSPSIAGGLIGHTKFANLNRTFNTGGVLGADRSGGLLGYAWGSASITESYAAATVSGTTNVDGLRGSTQGTLSTASTYVFASSRYVDSTPVADLKIASTFVGFDFDNVWGFGACTLNGGFPVIRSLGLANTYLASECGSGSSGSTPSLNDASTPAPAYEGPVVRASVTTKVSGAASYDGKRLDTVTKVMAGDLELTIRSATSQSLELQLPADLAVGVYDLVLLSSFGTLTFQQGLVVQQEAAVTPEQQEVSESGPVLTVGSFKGYIAIYTKGYEGQRLSAKVAGKWLVVPELDEKWRSYNFSRTVRFTGAGREITVDLYIDRKFVKSVEVETK